MDMDMVDMVDMDMGDTDMEEAKSAKTAEAIRIPIMDGNKMVGKSITIGNLHLPERSRKIIEETDMVTMVGVDVVDTDMGMGMGMGMGEGATVIIIVTIIIKNMGFYEPLQ